MFTHWSILSAHPNLQVNRNLFRSDSGSGTGGPTRRCRFNHKYKAAHAVGVFPSLEGLPERRHSGCDTPAQAERKHFDRVPLARKRARGASRSR